jgi:A/G-specific adenine glycosylase
MRRRRLTTNEVDELRSRLMKWGPRAYQRFPWRKRIPMWKGLLVEVMLQRTKAVQVVPAFNELDRRYRTASSLRELTAEEVQRLFSPLGLRWRAPLFLRLVREIEARNGRLPRTVRGLCALPAVGPYAAGAALSLHGHKRAIIVDSNVVRVVSRIFAADWDGETRRQDWVIQFLERLTPALQFTRFNYALIDLGMQLCRPLRPQCETCPIVRICATGLKSSDLSGRTVRHGQVGVER